MHGPARRFSWWPSYSPKGVADIAEHGRIGGVIASEVIAGLVFASPPIARATNIGPRGVALIVGIHLTWTIFVRLVLAPLARRRAAAFHVMLASLVMLTEATCMAFPLAAPSPQNPMWMLPCMYACMNGGFQETEAAVGLFAIHVLAPLLSIPIFLQSGADPLWSVAAPVMCATLSGFGYGIIAQRGERWRELRREHAEAMANLQARAADLERAHLARDLHDSVGASLGTVALYGDLVERYADQPDRLRRLASTLREAARSGTAELCAVLDSMDSSAGDVASLGEALAAIGSRFASAEDVVTVSVRVTDGAGSAVGAGVRMALSRVFQEAVHNAVRHGRAGHVAATLSAIGPTVALDVTDDGVGFDPEVSSTGRGLPGIRGRVAELGGSVAITAAPGVGVRVRIELPRLPQAAQ